MAISIINGASGNSSGYNNNIVISKPSGVINGDMLVAIIGCAGSQAGMSLSGWTRIIEVDKGSLDRSINVFYKIITNAAGEPSSYNFQHNSNAVMQGQILVLRGANITLPTFFKQGQSDDEPIGSNGQTPALSNPSYSSILVVSAITSNDTISINSSWGTVGGSPTLAKTLDIAPNSGSSRYVKLGVAVAVTGTGTKGGYTWPLVGGGTNADEMGLTFGILAATGGGGGGSCTCNAICDNVDLQDKINTTRNVCICDSHCNCDPGDCGCDGECPSDDYYYYYYYP
jgi:hypothetical protein